jgi:hypothetical protein
VSQPGNVERNFGAKNRPYSVQRRSEQSKYWCEDPAGSKPFQLIFLMKRKYKFDQRWQFRVGLGGLNERYWKMNGREGYFNRKNLPIFSKAFDPRKMLWFLMKIDFSVQKIFILFYKNIEYFFLEKIDSFFFAGKILFKKWFFFRELWIPLLLVSFTFAKKWIFPEENLNALCRNENWTYSLARREC